MVNITDVILVVAFVDIVEVIVVDFPFNTSTTTTVATRIRANMNRSTAKQPHKRRPQDLRPQLIERFSMNNRIAIGEAYIPILVTVHGLTIFITARIHVTNKTLIRQFAITG